MVRCGRTRLRSGIVTPCDCGLQAATRLLKANAGRPLRIVDVAGVPFSADSPVVLSRLSIDGPGASLPPGSTVPLCHHPHLGDERLALGRDFLHFLDAQAN